MVWQKTDSFQAKAYRVFAVALALTVSAVAEAGSGITYQGRILKPDGSPVRGQYVQFKMQIRSPGSGNCLMYEEQQTIDMRVTDGLFSIVMNDGSGTRTDSPQNYTLEQVLSNQLDFTFPAARCALGSTFDANEADGRVLSVSFKDETMGGVWEPMPAQSINYVPYAFQAKQIQGFGIKNLVRVEDAGGALSDISPLSNANFDELKLIIAGTSNLYQKAGQLNGVAVPSITNGHVLGWNGSAWTSVDPAAGVQAFAKTALPTCAAGAYLRNNSGALECTTPAVGGGGTVTDIATGTGLTGGPITSSGTISLATLNSGGSGYKISYDSYGRVTAAASIDEADLPTITTAGKVNGSAITGSISTTGTINSGAITSTGLVSSSSGSFTSLGTSSLQVFKSGSTTDKVTITAPAGLTAAGYSLSLPVDAGSANQVLSTNGSGALSWVDKPAATQWTTASPDIYFTGGKVGIGTMSPRTDIDVAGAINSNYGYYMNTYNDGTNWRTNIAGYSGLVYSDVNTGGMHFATSPSSQSAGSVTTNSIHLSIASSGNVGIGTTNPTTKLQVAGSVMLGNGAETCGSTYAGALRYNTSNLSVEYCNGTGWLVINSGASSTSANLATITNTSGSITLTPQATSSVYVNSTVASTSPSTGALVVSGGVGVDGSVNASGNLTAAGSIQASTGGIYGNATGNKELFHIGSGTASAKNAYLYAGINDTGSSTTSYSYLGGWDSRGPAAIPLVLQSSGGNVGIGTTSPPSKFSVVSTLTNTTTGGDGQIRIVNNSSADGDVAGILFQTLESSATANRRAQISAGRDGANTAGYLAFATRASGGAFSEGLRLNSSGKVGIGTTAPNYPLTITSADESNLLGIAFNGFSSDANSATGLKLFKARGDSTAPEHVLSNDTLGTINVSGFWTGKTPAFFVPGDSRASISVTATEDWTGPSNNGTALTFLTTPNGTSTQTERMRINQNGNIGIGTTSPSSLLHVAGADATVYANGGNGQVPQSRITLQNNSMTDGTYAQLAFVMNRSTTPTETAAIAAVSGDHATTGGGTGALTLSTRNGMDLLERMRISPTGNVGIGTTNPEAPLHAAVNSSGGNLVAISATNRNSTANTEVTIDLTPASTAPGVRSAQISAINNGGNQIAMSFKTSDGDVPAERMRITHLGQVGIGQSPTTALTVKPWNITNIGSMPAGWGGGLHTFDVYSGAGSIAVGDGSGSAVFGVGIKSSMNSAGIFTSGMVGIGLDNPSYKLQVAGTIAPTGNGANDLGAAANKFKDIYATNGTINTSDVREKKHIVDSDLGLDFIVSLRPVSYVWKNNVDQQVHYGLIAQETLKALGKAKKNSNRTNEIDNVIVTHDEKTDAYGVRYTELIAPMIKSIKELYAHITSIREENAKLRAENAEMRKRLDDIEKLLGQRTPASETAPANKAQ